MGGERWKRKKDEDLGLNLGPWEHSGASTNAENLEMCPKTILEN